ncbi:MAG: DUF433 domain-containing protein [Bryobacterales bacterium]|nr:DUF433 domain-containing protein [Bryobacterales bacterium]MBV9400858.1 DUF433 domain-containing protein [Bryobacterales bacterium]
MVFIESAEPGSPLDLVIRAFNRGDTPEQIADNYTSLRVSDVYQVIGYYLNHRNELDEYLDRRQGGGEGAIGRAS